jgi:hypothetical protein
METQQELLFDPATVVLDILATARVVQNEKNELVHVKDNLVFDYLLEELAGIEVRTISTFSDAAERVWDRIKPRIEFASNEKMIKVFQNTRNAIAKMKSDGFTIMLNEEYPLRLMLCWTDALGLVISAYDIIEKKMKSPRSRAFLTETQGTIYNVAIGAGILFMRVAEQTRACSQARLSKQYLEGDQIDAFVQLLAKDMAYLLKIQGEDRLPPEKDDFTAFQAFLIKNYGNA